jgi:uncharacterized protein
VLAIAAAGHAASFDCRRPGSSAEQTICANRELSQLDERLALVYKRFMSTSAQPYEDQRQHLLWIAERNGCADAGCIKERYAARLTQLRTESAGWLAYQAAEGAWVPANTGDAVCQAARAQLEALGGQDFAARGPEQKAGVLCGTPGRACVGPRSVGLDELTKAGASTDAPAFQAMLSSDSPISVTRVDLDNDGVADVRLAQRSGSADCERSVVLLGAAGGNFQLEMRNGYERLAEEGRLCGRERLSLFRYHDVNYVAEVGEQRVNVLRGVPREGLHPLCGFKRRWTEQEKRAAYAVLKRHPDILRNAQILRPEKDRAADGKPVWAVQVRCATGGLFASFQVDPRTLSPKTVVAPGSDRSGRCDTARVVQEMPAVAPQSSIAANGPLSQ